MAFPQQADRFASLLASAQEAQSRSDFSAAAGFYQQAAHLHPEIPELQANLGLMYYQTGNDEQACPAFRRALRLKPGMFVPNLFLGLSSVRLKRFNEAITYFDRAERSKPTDVQVQLGRGEAYRLSGRPRLATAAYSRAADLDPGNANVLYHLGVSYLELVEADARVLLNRHIDSGYVQALLAETYAEQHALIQADDTYKKTLALAKFPPGAHAGYGFVLLNRHDSTGARRQFNAELAANPGSLLAKLGTARLHLEQGEAAQSAKEIGEIQKADAGFLRANASLFIRGLGQSKRADLVSALQQGQAAEVVSLATADLFSETPNRGTMTSGAAAEAGVNQHAVPAELYAEGSYRKCTDALTARTQSLSSRDLELLASCAYLTGDYRRALGAAAKLSASTATEAEGLYWETKSAQALATHSLSRASLMDANSPRLHVLLGDIYRQQKSFPDADQEYRKALALSPVDTGAQFGLSLALLAEGQNDEALGLARAALGKNPEDPELNAVMGEILCANNDFEAAEPFLKKSLDTKPEFIARVHALLGNVYAKTNRTQEAIAELKLGLPSDKDGSLHYQIARLYLKVGDGDSARQAFEVSKQLQREGLMRAAVALQQGGNDAESP